jgi:hypothetical protein
MKRYLILLACAFTLCACADGIKTESAGTPQDHKKARKDSRGKLTGEEGLVMFGGSDEGKATASPLGVNSYLWRATLDTLSFMPLASADPFGGVIITDWYEDPKTLGERFKINAIILDKTLRADGVKISVFKQKFDKNVWRDQKVDTKLERSLEDTILTRARQLRVNQGR